MQPVEGGCIGFGALRLCKATSMFGRSRVFPSLLSLCNYHSALACCLVSGGGGKGVPGRSRTG